MSSTKSRKLLGSLAVAIVGLLVVALPAAAAARDRNHDRIPDRWEKRHHLSLHKNQAQRNQDRDGLKNRQEWKAGDDPRDPDSDNDGVEDGDEGAGTIASFQDHVLTIDLFGGGSISGTVTESTEVKCDNGDDQGDEDNDGEGGHHGDTGDGEDQGDQGDVGDDPGEQAGDDSHADKSATGDQTGNDENDNDDEDANDQGDDNHACSVDNLVPGAVVQEADLELEHGQAVFEEIELAK
ncbi:MAG: hypothetical protein ACRDMH_04215 [Solirubrobacterales bacterium]